MMEGGALRFSCEHLTFFFTVPLLLLLLAMWLMLGPPSSSYYYYVTDGSTRRRRKELPPGSFGLPFGVGETLQFALCNTCTIGSPPPFLSSRLRKYGTIYKTHLMGSPTVVSMDHDLNKFLLSNEGKLVQVTYPRSLKNILGPLLTLHGEGHQRFRELVSSIIGPATIQSLHFIPSQQHTCSILRPWLHMPIIDAQNEFKKFTFTYIVKILLSLAPEDPNTEFLMRNYSFLMSGFTAIPLDLPGTTYNKVLKKEHMFIRKNKRENELLDWDDFKKMEFTQLVIKETLRIASIAHFVMREAIQDIYFKDMVIPKGWTIFINFSMVHLNPSHYKNPLKFDPWRWKDLKNNNQACLMPFSGGIRSCPGSYFAKLEASIFIHYLVTSYKWNRITKLGEKLDVVSSLSFPTMKKGLPIKVEPL